MLGQIVCDQTNVILFNCLFMFDLPFMLIFDLQVRRLNQDLLECTFGIIRSHCGSNANPTASQFKSALKAAILNNLTSSDLKGQNCELESDVEMFSTLKQFLNLSGSRDLEDSSSSSDATLAVPLDIVDPADASREGAQHVTRTCPTISQQCSVAYVAGFIVRRVFEQHKCQACWALLTSIDSDDPSLAFISLKEYSQFRRGLIYPSPLLVEAVGEAVEILSAYLKVKAHHVGLSSTVTRILVQSQRFDLRRLSCCDDHASVVGSADVRAVCRIFIPWWGKLLNRGLSLQKAVKRAAYRKLMTLTNQ